MIIFRSVRLFCICGLMLAFNGHLAEAQTFEANIMTGSATGTYIQFGNDIRAAAQKHGLSINVVQSKGSLENIFGVFKRRHTQFGIVQHDVLDFIREFKESDPEMKKIAELTRIAYPLYNEEVHILARRDVRSLSDLNNRRVGVGRSKSGTNLTAGLVLDAAGVQAKRVNISASAALKEMVAGNLDAFFYVAGAPTKLFSNPLIDGNQFRLLPISNRGPLSSYVKSTINRGTYPWLQEDVEVIAVKAVMMTYEFEPTRNFYHKQACDVVTGISGAIKLEFENLKRSGHPKWRQVDLDDIPPGWKQAQCVTKSECDYLSNPLERIMCKRRKLENR